MANVAAQERSFIPEMDIPTETPVIKTLIKSSLWARIKNVVRRAVALIARPFLRATEAIRVAVTKAVALVKSAWSRAFKPYLRNLMIGAALVYGVSLIITAPIITAVMGLAAILVYRTKAFTAFRKNRFVQMLFGGLSVTAYVCAASVAIMACIPSLTVTLLTGMHLAIHIYLSRKIRKETQEQVVEATDEVSAIRTEVMEGLQEVADLLTDERLNWAANYDNDDACAACGTHKGAIRIRSNATTVVDGIQVQSTDEFCGECFDAECEDIAIAMTGVSLNKRRVLITLNAFGRAQLAQTLLSKQNEELGYWVEVAWWRDRRGEQYPRQWDLLQCGEPIASVLHDPKNNAYRSVVGGKVVATSSTLEKAREEVKEGVIDAQVEAHNDAVRREVVAEAAAWKKSLDEADLKGSSSNEEGRLLQFVKG